MYIYSSLSFSHKTLIVDLPEKIKTHQFSRWLELYLGNFSVLTHGTPEYVYQHKRTIPVSILHFVGIANQQMSVTLGGISLKITGLGKSSHTKELYIPGLWFFAVSYLLLDDERCHAAKSLIDFLALPQRIFYPNLLFKRSDSTM